MADLQQSRLLDTQDSLATALARLEAHRTRERILFRENQALRGALLQNGFSPAQLKDLVRSPVVAAMEGADPNNQQSPVQDQLCEGAGTLDPPSLQLDGHPVHYLISNAQVKLEALSNIVANNHHTPAVGVMARYYEVCIQSLNQRLLPVYLHWPIACRVQKGSTAKQLL